MLWTMRSIYTITLKYKVFECNVLLRCLYHWVDLPCCLPPKSHCSSACLLFAVEVMLMWSSAYWQFHQWVVPLEVWARCQGSTFGSKMRTHHRCCWKPFIRPSTMLWNFQTLGDLLLLGWNDLDICYDLGISMVLGWWWWWSWMKSPHLGDNKLIQLFNSTFFQSTSHTSRISKLVRGTVSILKDKIWWVSLDLVDLLNHQLMGKLCHDGCQGATIKG